MFQTLLLVAATALGQAPTEIPLWKDKAPESVGEAPQDKPTITIYPAAADKRSGAGVVICPGGGYGFLAMDHEGKQVAELMAKNGITAFVLKYRIVAKERPGPLGKAPMLDVQRALRYARAYAKEYQIDENKIGVWGFSAGGHLASTAATHFDAGDKDAKDPIDKVSCRPDFAVLSYPVVSMQAGVTHGGSKKNLLGDKPDEKMVEYFSNEKQVTKDTPPTFLFHTDEDKAVIPENSLLFYQACKKNNVPVEMHIYEKGPHGVGLGTDPKWAGKAPNVDTWSQRLIEWMTTRGLVKK